MTPAQQKHLRKSLEERGLIVDELDDGTVIIKAPVTADKKFATYEEASAYFFPAPAAPTGGA